MLANFFMDDTIFTDDDVDDADEIATKDELSSIDEHEKESSSSAPAHIDKDSKEAGRSSGWLDSWRQYWNHTAQKQSEFKLSLKER
jgi:hypothetical protein